MHNVEENQWQSERKPHPVQEDNSSCGVFVALIIDLCMSRQKIEFPLDMLGLRRMMLNTILAWFFIDTFFCLNFLVFYFSLFSNKISNSIVLFFYVGRGKKIIALKTGSNPGLRFGSNPGQLINHDYNQEEKK